MSFFLFLTIKKKGEIHMIRVSSDNPADELRRRGELRCEITGTSMQPLLKSKKNTVHICYMTHDPQPLDVVLFCRDNGSFVLHRILDDCDGVYTLCGDNQTKKEFAIRKEQIVGRMEGYYKGESYHSCDSLSYRLYSNLWVKTICFRRLWISLKQQLGGR